VTYICLFFLIKLLDRNTIYACIALSFDTFFESVCSLVNIIDFSFKVFRWGGESLKKLAVVEQNERRFFLSWFFFHK
jgi:hypothetical protein